MFQQDKKTQMSDAQKQCLIEYIKNNSDLQSAKFSNHFTFKDAQKKWTEIGDILNSMPGATRDWKNWRKTWQDLKSRTKTKVSNAKRYAKGTGGGPPIEGELSKIEENIIDIVKVVSLEGHKETAESEVNFNFDTLSEEQNAGDFFFKIAEPSETINEERVSKNNDKSFPRRKSSKLVHTIKAVDNFKISMDEKIELKRKYYDEKLGLLRSIASAKDRKADAAERTASASERMATALEKIAESML